MAKAKGGHLQKRLPLANVKVAKLPSLKVLRTKLLNLITDKEDEKSKIYRCVRTSSIHVGCLCFELPSHYAYIKRGKSSTRD